MAASLSITTVGADGSATATGTVRDVYGLLMAVYIEYLSQPVTTVIAFKQTVGGITETMLTITGNTNGVFRPLGATVDNVGTAAVDNHPHTIDGKIDVTITLADSAEIVNMWFVLI